MSKQVYVRCNAPNKSKHCLTYCQCGIPHLKESGRDACHLNWETCTLSKDGIVKVICKPIKRGKI
jgi:hypothetical protein